MHRVLATRQHQARRIGAGISEVSGSGPVSPKFTALARHGSHAQPCTAHCRPGHQHIVGASVAKAMESTPQEGLDDFESHLEVETFAGRGRVSNSTSESCTPY